MIFCCNGNKVYRLTLKTKKAAEKSMSAAKTWKLLQADLPKINPKIIIDIDTDFVLERVRSGFKIIFFKVVYIHGLFRRIYNPVRRIA